MYTLYTDHVNIFCRDVFHMNLSEMMLVVQQKKLMCWKCLYVFVGLEKKVDLRRVNLDALKPWIADKIAKLLSESVRSFTLGQVTLSTWADFIQSGDTLRQALQGYRLYSRGH